MEFDLGKAKEVLTATPTAVRGLLSGLSEEWTSSGGRDDWGPRDIVAHLIYADREDWIPRARVILSRGDVRDFPPFDRYGHFEASDGKSLSMLLDEFDDVRGRCIRTVESWQLDEDRLSLTGKHPEFGEVELRQLLATWVVHDLTHIRQISTSMAKRYQTAVGPWREYLSILK